MRQFNIYLAGTMGGLSHSEMNNWRVDISRRLQHTNNYYGYNYDLKITNPVDYYNFKSVDYKTHKEVMNFDINRVRNSDLIIVKLDNEKSVGTSMELMLAYELHIPIIALKGKDTLEIHPWIECCCDRICDSEDELIQHIENFFFS